MLHLKMIVSKIGISVSPLPRAHFSGEAWKKLQGWFFADEPYSAFAKIG